MNEERYLRVAKTINEELNGTPVNPYRIYRGDNHLSRLWNRLNGVPPHQIFPDSRRYLEELGVEIIGEAYAGGAYECLLPRDLRIERQNNQTEGDMSRVRVYDGTTGALVISQFLKLMGNLEVIASEMRPYPRGKLLREDEVRKPIPEKDQDVIREHTLSINTDLTIQRT